MNDDHEHDHIARQLRTALPPWRDLELAQDLWPRMLRRMEESLPRFGWFESILLGLVGLVIAIYPQAIVMMLYHL